MSSTAAAVNCHRRMPSSRRPLPTLSTAADTCLRHGDRCRRCRLLPPSATAAHRRTQNLLMFAVNNVIIHRPSVRPPNGTRTEEKPHPSRGGGAYAPEVWDLVMSMWQNGDDLNTPWLEQLTVPPVDCHRHRQPLSTAAPIDCRLRRHVLPSSRAVVALHRPLPLTAEPLRHRQDCAKELRGVHGVFPPPRGCRLVIDVGRWAPSFSSHRKGGALMDVALSSSKQLPLTPPLPSFLLPFPFGSEQ